MICGMLPGTCNLQFHITRRNGLVSAICSCFYDTTIVSCEGYVEGTYPTPTLFTGELSSLSSMNRYTLILAQCIV